MGSNQSERIEYHLGELETARTPSDAGHIMPEILDTEIDILDVGCGIGQTLASLGLGSSRNLVGVDIEVDPLVYGDEHFSAVSYANCSAESLPFAENSFDLIISRVALPYTDLRKSLTEMHRVSRPGGRIWITLHPWRMTVKQLLKSTRRGYFKDLLFRAYVLSNGALFHYFGKQVKFPLADRTESFQTRASMTRELEALGFTNIKIKRDRHFLITAEKRKIES